MHICTRALVCVCIYMYTPSMYVYIYIHPTNNTLDYK